MPSKQITVPKKGIGDMFSDEEFNQILDAISGVDNSGASGYGIRTADIYSYGNVETAEGFKWSNISTGKELVVDTLINNQKAQFLNETEFSGDHNTFTNSLLIHNPSGTAKLTSDNIDVNDQLLVSGKTILKTHTDIATDPQVGGNINIGANDSNNSLTINCSTNFKNGDVTITSGKFNAKQSAEIGSTLKVEGSTTLNNTLYVKEATTLDSTLDVTDATHLNDTLTVEKAAQLNDTLSVTKETTLNDTLTVEKAAQLNDTLTVEKSTQLNDTLTVEKSTQLNDTLTVEKSTTLKDDALLEKKLTVTGITTLKANAILESNLTVNGTSTLKDNVQLQKALSVGTTLTVVGDTTLSNANISNTATIKDLIVNNLTTLNKEVEITGTTKSTNYIVVADTNARANTLLDNAETTGTGNHKKIIADYLDVTDTISINGITTETRNMLKSALDPLFWQRILEIFKILDVQGVTINDLVDPEYSLTTNTGAISSSTKFSIQKNGPANLNNAMLAMQAGTTLYLVGPQGDGATTESPQINVKNQLLALWKSLKTFSTSAQYEQLVETDPLTFTVSYRTAKNQYTDTTITGNLQTVLTSLASAITTLSNRIGYLEQ